jgi:hypothetical protein
MPTYNFRNKDTGEETEITMSMSELDQYKEDNPHLEQFLTVHLELLEVKEQHVSLIVDLRKCFKRLMNVLQDLN